MAWSDAAREAALAVRRAHMHGRVANVLYHVTQTSKTKSIMKKGIVPFQTSNWVKAGSGERYGGGEIFAFRARQDAVRWAAKMDWAKNQKFASGKIAIAIFKEPKRGWVKDTADPLGQAGRAGNWLKKMGSVAPKNVRAVVPVSQAMVRKATAKFNQR